MSGLDRIYLIDRLLATGKCFSRHELEQRLGISWSTLKRDISYMKDRLHAPIIYDRTLGGYRFESNENSIGPQYELPGLWFSAEEIHTLLTIQHLLCNLDPGGLLGPHIQPLLARLSALLGSADDPIDEVKRRVRIETVGARDFHFNHFQVIGSALLRRKRLVIQYYARGNNNNSEREISPQRLIYYRDNWYLDAFCHLRKDLRAFSLDGIKEAELLDRHAIDIQDHELDQKLGSGYGIFSGEDVTWATLQFSAERARWVASERWHPKQQGRWLKDGSYELRIPYSDDREIIMDIMRYGPDCKVVEPVELALKIQDYFKCALKCYT